MAWHICAICQPGHIRLSSRVNLARAKCTDDALFLCGSWASCYIVNTQWQAVKLRNDKNNSQDYLQQWHQMQYTDKRSDEKNDNVKHQTSGSVNNWTWRFKNIVLFSALVLACFNSVDCNTNQCLDNSWCWTNVVLILQHTQVNNITLSDWTQTYHN